MTRKLTIELTCTNDTDPNGLFETGLALTFTPDLSPDDISNVRVMATVMLNSIGLPLPPGLAMSATGMQNMKQVILSGILQNTKPTGDIN